MILHSRYYKSLEGQIVFVNMTDLKDDKNHRLVIYTDGFTGQRTITTEEIFNKKFLLFEKKK